MRKREMINKIISELKKLDRKIKEPLTYAIEKNIDFFESTKSILNYLIWLTKIAPNLDSSRLLEINELLPKYDEIMHKKLLKMERIIPGLVGIIVVNLTNFILAQKKPLVILDIGSGSMEIERQVITKLSRKGFKEKIVFIGLDVSVNTYNSVYQNFSELNNIVHIEKIEDKSLANILSEKFRSQYQFNIIQMIGNVMQIDELYANVNFDVIFHTLFRHHLSRKEQNELDDILKKRKGVIMEYDGYRNLFGMIPQSFIGWFDPIFLNAEIFSNLRFISKKSVKERQKHLRASVKFSQIGYYLLKYDS